MSKTFIEEFVAKIGWEYDEKSAAKAQKNLNSTAEGIGKSIKRLALSMVSLYAVKAVSSFVVGTNKATAQIDNLGKAVGVSVAFMDALQGAMANTGIGAETILRSISRLNKNMGEFAISGQGRMGRSLRALGISFKEIKDLKPEDQFAKIVDTIQKAPNFQKAMGAASAILGEDAYRLVGYLRATNTSMSELIKKYADMDVMTDESHAGAQKFTAVWNDLNFVLNAIKGTFAGFLGEALSPMVEEFREFIVNNRELVRSKLKQWAVGLVAAFRKLIIMARGVFDTVSKIIGAFGGLENVLRIVKFALAGIVLNKTVGFLGKVGTALSTGAGRAGIMSTALGGLKTAFLALAALSIDDIIGFWNGKDSVFGRAVIWAEDAIGGFARALERVLGAESGTIPRILIKADQWFSEFGDALDNLREKLSYFIYLIPGLSQLMIAKNIIGVIKGTANEIAVQAEDTAYTGREGGRPEGMPGAKTGPGLGPVSPGPTRKLGDTAPEPAAAKRIRQHGPMRDMSTTVNVDMSLDSSPMKSTETYDAYMARMAETTAVRVKYEVKKAMLKELRTAGAANTAGRQK